MGLSHQEKLEIAEIVAFVLEGKLDDMRKEIMAGFVECLDWHNDNFAKIIQDRNGVIVGEITKRQREVIEIHTKEKQEKELKEKALDDAAASKSVGFIVKSKNASNPDK